MKLIPQWNEKEDKNSLIGLVVYCPNEPGIDSFKDLSYILSTTHIIGYNPKKKNHYTFTSLQDGMTISLSLKGLIFLLNEQPYLPMSSTLLQACMGHKVKLI